jgi:xylose isomerase
MAGPWFPNVTSPIPYKPDAKANELAYRYYNAKEVIMGKTMEEWCRFSVVYWHTWRYFGKDPFGGDTMARPWEDGTDDLNAALRRMRVNFEFLSKLGVKYWAFHDRDIAPEGKTLAESNANLDTVVDLALQLQAETGIQLLWGTCNLFSHERYMNGAATSTNPEVWAYAAASVKKMLEVTKRLGGTNFVFWGGREGYGSLLNTAVKRELDHMAAFFKMVKAYALKIGFTGQFLIEPKAREPSGHQYDYDAQTVIGFLKTYGLDDIFKLNIEPNHTQLAGHRFVHDVHMAAKLGYLGSVDCNTGSEDLGWDTDEFIFNAENATEMMLAVVQNGGLGSGGLNFDCKVRRDSTDIYDLFWGHVAGIDQLAFGLRKAVQLVEEGTLAHMVADRYRGWDSGLGARIEAGTITIEECEALAMQNQPVMESSHEERFKLVFARTIQSRL